MKNLENLFDGITSDVAVGFFYPTEVDQNGWATLNSYYMYAEKNDEGSLVKYVSRLGQRMIVDSVKSGWINLVNYDMMGNKTKYQMILSNVRGAEIMDIVDVRR